MTGIEEIWISNARPNCVTEEEEWLPLQSELFINWYLKKKKKNSVAWHHFPACEPSKSTQNQKCPTGKNNWNKYSIIYKLWHKQSVL